MVGRYFLQPHVVLGGPYVRPPHNRLVTESAVSYSRVPPQMMPSELHKLPLLSLIPHNGRNDRQPWICGKCGTCHRENHWCPAVNRICYNCRRYGHYAEYCISRKTKIPDNQVPKTPSETEPVNQVSVSILTESDDKAVQKLTSQLCALEQKSSKSEHEKKLLRVECASLGVKNQQLSDQQHQLEKELSPLRITCADFKVQNKDLAEQLSQAEQSLGEAKQKATLQEEQLHKLLQYSVMLDGCCTEFEHLTKHLLQESYQVLVHYEPDGRSLCNRCGTGSHPQRYMCPANGWLCCRCGKTNHFATMCSSESLPSPVSDEDTKLLIRTLEQATGITFGKTINCISCEDDADVAANVLS